MHDENLHNQIRMYVCIWVELIYFSVLISCAQSKLFHHLLLKSKVLCIFLWYSCNLILTLRCIILTSNSWLSRCLKANIEYENEHTKNCNITTHISFLENKKCSVLRFLLQYFCDILKRSLFRQDKSLNLTLLSFMWCESGVSLVITIIITSSKYLRLIRLILILLLKHLK